MNITKEVVVGSDFAYTFNFDGWELYMEGYFYDTGYEVILYNGDNDKEICILEIEKDNNPRYDIDAWLIIQNEAHTVMRNIWKLK